VVNDTPSHNYIRDVTCHMGSRSVTWHPTQANAITSVSFSDARCRDCMLMTAVSAICKHEEQQSVYHNVDKVAK